MHQCGTSDAATSERTEELEVSSVPASGTNGTPSISANKTASLPSRRRIWALPLANDPRVREARDLSIDREALNKVALDGQNLGLHLPSRP